MTTIFFYTGENTFETYRNQSFVPFFIEDASKEDYDEAESFCSGERSCIYDFLATRDEELALLTKESNDNANDLQATLGELFPHIISPLCLIHFVFTDHIF